MSAINDATGNALEYLIGQIGLASEECKICKGRKHIMNQWSIEHAERNIHWPVRWMKEAARKKNLSFCESQARWLVSLAIDMVRLRRMPTKMESARLRAMRIWVTLSSP